MLYSLISVITVLERQPYEVESWRLLRYTESEHPNRSNMAARHSSYKQV